MENSKKKNIQFKTEKLSSKPDSPESLTPPKPNKRSKKKRNNKTNRKNKNKKANNKKRKKKANKLHSKRQHRRIQKIRRRIIFLFLLPKILHNYFPNTIPNSPNPSNPKFNRKWSFKKWR